VPDHYIDEERSMSSQWDPEEVHGEWISKEVYFKDGWPSVMRDPIRKWVSITDEEIGVPTEPIQPNEAIMFARVIESLIKAKNT
jgi:hypothetical protein